jgi:hypothetical protein
MTFPLPVTPCPTLAGFTQWVYGFMGVPAAWLPTDSQYIFWAYNTAVATVNPLFRTVPGPIYLQMTYNLAGHLLASWAPDPVPWPNNQPYKTIDGVGLGFFQWLRQVNNISGFVTGIVQSSGDEGTNVSLVVPKQAENLTIQQLGLTTTVWGRAYLGYAQDLGTNWGVT